MVKWHERLPASVTGRAHSLGESGSQWLNNLDNYVPELENTWDIRVTDVLSGGSHAFIGAAVNPAGRKYVLKIELPDYPLVNFLRGAEMLNRANGMGYCRIYAIDLDKRAVLLERLGDALKESQLSPEMQMTILCRALEQTWNLPLNTEESARDDNNYHWFRTYIPHTWQELDRPCSEKVVESAMHYVDWLSSRTDPAQYVWIHGDAHNANMLRVPGTNQYKFIDPDGKIFERSYDVGVLMREWPDSYDASPYETGRERSHFLSKLTGIPAQDIWAWGYLQMVATALILLQIGQTALGRKMLSIAEHWA